MFIVMDITNYMEFVPFFFDIYHIMICNKFNKRNIRQIIRPFYVFINDWWTHNLYLELKGITSII